MNNYKIFKRFFIILFFLVMFYFLIVEYFYLFDYLYSFFYDQSKFQEFYLMRRRGYIYKIPFEKTMLGFNGGYNYFPATVHKRPDIFLPFLIFYFFFLSWFFSILIWNWYNNMNYGSLFFLMVLVFMFFALICRV